MDPIKEAFSKAKQDIFNLQSQLENMRRDMQEIKRTLNIILENQQTNKPTNNQSNQQSNQFKTSNSQYSPIPSKTASSPTNQQKKPSFYEENPTHKITPIHNLSQYGLIPLENKLSIGNEGVPTNQPTTQPTNQHTGNEGVQHTLKYSEEDKISHLEKVSEVLKSLDSIKKELRHKFKRLSKQEMAIFSSIYQLEEQGFVVDYSLLSQKLSLSEISIRDFVRKLIQKKVPIQKIKENNKKITLSIPEELKKIASLNTILTLREL